MSDLPYPNSHQVNGTHAANGTPGAQAHLPPSADPMQKQLQTQGHRDKGKAPRQWEHPPPEPAPGSIPVLECGPLLRYCGTDYPSKDSNEGPVWRGTVLLIMWGTADGTPVPELYYTGDVVEGDSEQQDEGVGLAGQDISSGNGNNGKRIHTNSKDTRRRLILSIPKLILAEDNTLFYRYPITVRLEAHERPVTYFIHGIDYGDDHLAHSSPNDITNGSSNNEKQFNHQEHSSGSADDEDAFIRKSTTLPPHTTHRTFYVPSASSSMRILFHSCNGFSVGTAEDEWSGPALWNDVLRHHSTHPFHVMIGGGDQIYSDAIRVSGPLKDWSKMGNPAKRRRYPYTDSLSVLVNRWYRQNYIQWFGTYPFAKANGRIPQINIWDDHDIIDGYGSYTDHFMRCPVFIGVGNAAWRYYMVFQHHTPPGGEYSVPAPATDPSQSTEDKSFIIGAHPGRYIHQHSRSIYARLGRHIAFLGLDARTERTRHQIVTPETYDLVFSRLEEEFSHGDGEIQHLIILLGVPIAYPRLVWLEYLLRSPAMGFVKFLNKRFGLAGTIFNKFDGNVDILDDLDDHWCAAVHKRERNQFIARLQQFSRDKSVRITILSGDVHLAAIGRFYTRPGALGEADETGNNQVEHDHRYIPNIISSAITNVPPPPTIAKMLARRNIIHHFDHVTDERLLEFFDVDVDGEEVVQKATMPRRNYCVITQGTIHQHPSTPPDSAAEPQTTTDEKRPNKPSKDKSSFRWSSCLPHSSRRRREVKVGQDERSAGSRHPAVNAVMVGVDEGGDGGALNVALRVEIDKKDPGGWTKGYGFRVPVLGGRGTTDQGRS